MTDLCFNAVVFFTMNGQSFRGQVKVLNDDHAVVAFLHPTIGCVTAKVPYSLLSR